MLIRRFVQILAPVFLLLGFTACSPAPEPRRPNILLILADDLGYADLGVFGSEIPTPNLDALAANGLLLTDFYANMTCSPTRSMLMSGTDSHLAGLGVMGRPARADQRGQPGYEGFLNFRVASLADLMTDAGYNTYMTGKWHLGTEVETGPRARGFKRSFVSLDGAAHLGGLSWNGPALAPYRDGEEVVTVGDDFYSTRFYTQRMMSYIEADRAAGKPFFAYLAYTAPHWPLQAPAASSARFAHWYDAGYEVLYESRFRRMQALNLLPADAEPAAEWSVRWAALSPEQQRIEARKMEIYAAMVSDLDSYVGELIAYLKDIGEFDNTFIMFMSDNGAEGLRRELTPPLSNWVADCCDNRYDNMGTGTSYLMYGPDWATASSTPFRRHKGTAFEGGIHVPAFVHYRGLAQPGARSDGFGTVMDLLPTFLALAGSEHPGSVYRGQPVLPLQGKSLLPLLRGERAEVHDGADYVGWELYGQRGIRQGDWKIVWDSARGEQARWYLFNVTEDPAERNDLALANPARLAQMLSLWDRYEAENGVVY
ncbi:MAG: arylsulfatase [Pseudomonadales bacterium]|nr:arylsulfatase [Pseudomonadales bacterium]